MKFETNFTYDQVRHDQDNNTHLVVSLTAPKKNWQEERPPVCIVPVIDVSGSMGGEKLEYAKKSAMKLVDHLQPGDFAGLVVFASCVELISPVMEMTQDKKEALKVKIGQLEAIDCTNFSGGMLTGLEQLNKSDLPDNLLLRVIMLTDGVANVGVAINRDQLIPLLESNLGRGTLSAFGYGEDANQELLADLASVGKGNYAFIKNPDDALSAFAKELGGLLSTYAQNISVDIKANNGHTIENVVSDVDVDGDKSNIIIKFPEILSEEERNLVVEMKLSEQSKALPRQMSVVDISLTYDLIDSNGKKDTRKESVKGKIKFVKPGKEQVKPHEDIDKVVALAQTIQAQIEAEERAQAGDYSGARLYMQNLSTNLRSRGLEKYATLSDSIGTKMGNAMDFCANSAYFTSTRSAGTRAYGTSALCCDAADDLSFCDVNLKNTAQDSLQADFTNNNNKVDLNNGSGGSSGGENVIIPAVGGGIVFIESKDDKKADKKADKKGVKDNKKDKKKKSRITKKKSKRW